MHSRRLACFLLGLWLAGGIVVAFVTRENPRAVDRLTDDPNPVVRLELKNAGGASARLLLHHLAGEQNRFLLETWETAQLMLGLFFFFFLLFGTREDKYSLAIPLLMLVITLVQRFVLSPEMIAAGRIVDFLAEKNSTDRVRLMVLQRAYPLTELAKGGLGLLLAIRLVFADWWRRSGSDVRKQLDLVDKANYGHVDR